MFTLLRTIGWLIIFMSLSLDYVAASEEVPQSLTLDGRLYSDSAATIPLADIISLKVQVLNPAQNCILYEETQSVNTTSTAGYYTIHLGQKAGPPAGKRSAGDSNISLANVFSNTAGLLTGKLASDGSTACNYTATSGDQRYFRFLMTPASDNITRTTTSNLLIDSVPLALVAERAENLRGLTPNQFLQVNNSTSVLTQANLESLFSASNYANLSNLVATPATSYVLKNANGSAVIPSVAGNPGSGLAIGQIWYDSTNNLLKYYDGSTKTLSTSSGAGNFANGGNSFTAAANLGTNDAFNLNFLTNGTSRMTIDSAGKIGIGTTTPTSPLHAVGNSATSLTALTSSMTATPTVDGTEIYKGSYLSATNSGDFALTGLYGNYSYARKTGNGNADYVYGDFANATAAGGNGSSAITSLTGISGVGSTGTFSGTIGNLYGGQFIGSASSGLGTSTNVFGIYSLGTSTSGSTTNIYGSYSLGSDGSPANSPTGIYGNYGEASTSSNGFDASNAYGGYFKVNHVATNSTIANAQGGFFEVLKGGGTGNVTTNAYGIRIGSVQGTNKWSIYASDSTSPSFFAGNVGIGVSLPSSLLDLNGALTYRAIAAPALSAAGTGRMFYDSTQNHFYYSENGGAYAQLGATSSNLTSITSIANSAGNLSLSPAAATGSVLVTSGTASVGAASGALVVTGGIGTSGDIYSAASINAATTISALTSILTPQLYGSASASGTIKIDGTSNATKGNVLLASAGGNVGIGTTSPTAQFHVVRSTASTATFDSSGSGTYSNIDISKGGNAYGTLISYGSDNNFYVTARAATGNLQLGAGGVDSLLTINPGGAVGVGTTSPSQKLDVQGNIGIGANMIGGGLSYGCSGCGTSTSIELYNSGTSAMNFYGRDNGGSAAGFNFYTSGVPRFRINDNGNVGIGTTSPTGPLHVFSSTAGMNVIKGEATGSAANGVVGTAACSVCSGVNGLSSNVSGYGVQATNTGGGYAFYSGAGTNYFAGNVGIGTAAPGATLDVRGTVSLSRTTGSGAFFSATDSSNSSNSNIQNNVFGSYFSPSSTPSGYFTGLRNWVSFNSGVNSASSITGFQNSASTTSGGGDVGSIYGIANSAANNFGTATSLFGAHNSITASSTTTNATVGYFGATSLANSTATNGVDISVSQILGTTTTSKGINVAVTKGGSGAIGTAYGIYLGNVQGTTAFSLFASDSTAPSYFAGNVGVGTTAPAAQTEIYGVGQTTADITDAGAKGGMLLLRGNNGVSAGTGGAVLFGSSGGMGVSYFAGIKGLLTTSTGNTAGDLAISLRSNMGDTNLSEKMRITAAGNVGIGTSAPSASLDVNGHVGVSSAGTPALSGCGTSPSITGNDTRGNVTTGSTSVLSCTITFATAYATAPYCVLTGFSVNAATGYFVSSTSTTTLVVGFNAGTTSKQFTYMCLQ